MDTSMELETLGCSDCTFGDLGYFPLPSPQIPFSEINNFSGPADVPEDGRPCSTDTDMLGVNDAAAPQAAPPVPVGGGGHAAAPWCATEIQHLEVVEEEDAQRRFHSWKQSDVEQEPRLFGEVEPWSLTAPDEKLVEAQDPAPEDDRPSGADANMAEVNEAVPQPGALPFAVGGGDANPFAYAISELSKKEAQRRFASFRSAIVQDLISCGMDPWELLRLKFPPEPIWLDIQTVRDRDWDWRQKLELREYFDLSTRKRWTIVPFRGPESKGRNHQGRWKEKSIKGQRAVADPSSPQPPAPGQEQEVGWKETSMKGLRAVADTSSPQPPPAPGQEQQQQGYVGLKKTLELDDDGNGNRWRANEYTPLLPSDDDPSKLVPAEISLRFEFKVDQPAPSSAKEDEPAPASPKEDEPAAPSPAFSLPSKRSRSGAPKTAPKKSPVWKHMTKVHVKVATTNTDGSGSQRKKPACYKVMFAICHHCDKVFNADSNHGTHNLSKHLETCNDCKCTHSHSR